MLTAALRTRRIFDAARELGFPFVGAAPAGAAPHAEAFRAWLEAGCVGEMAYLARNADVRADPRTRFGWLKSILTVGLPYDHGPQPDDDAAGRLPALLSRYAQGDDYHELMESRLRTLAEHCRLECGAGQARWYVDTGPVLERDWAAQSGVGFQGKNAMIIHPGAGSWFFLGEVLLDVELEPPERTAGGCGSCVRCIEACPTGAITAPYVVDARRCLSYLNIELRGWIPDPLRELMGGHLFGCDICQAVCPFNRTEATSFSVLPALRTRAAYEGVHAHEIIEIDEQNFRRLFQRSALRRAKRSGIRRNAMIVSANLGLGEAAGPLVNSLADTDPVLRGTAAWALGRLRLPETRTALDRALAREADPHARRQIAAALGTTQRQ